MTVSKDAIDAAASEIYRVYTALPLYAQAQMNGCLANELAVTALTAALPFLARPAPSQSDEQLAWDLAPDGYGRDSHNVRREIANALTALRAEATLAGAAAERKRWREWCSRQADTHRELGRNDEAGAYDVMAMFAAIRARK